MTPPKDYIDTSWQNAQPWLNGAEEPAVSGTGRANPYGETPAEKAAAYNSMIASGMSDAAIRQKVSGELGQQSDADWMYLRGLASAGATPTTTVGPLTQVTPAKPLPVQPPPPQLTPDQLFPTPVLNALYANQQQRMLSSAPRFNFQSGVNTPVQQPTTPMPTPSEWNTSPGAPMPQTGGGSPYEPNMPSPYHGGQNGKAPALESGNWDTTGEEVIAGLLKPGAGPTDPHIANPGWGTTPGTGIEQMPGVMYPFGRTPEEKAASYNRFRASGMSDFAIRNMVNDQIGQQSNEDWAYLQSLANNGTGGGDPYTPPQSTEGNGLHIMPPGTGGYGVSPGTAEPNLFARTPSAYMPADGFSGLLGGTDVASQWNEQNQPGALTQAINGR